MTAFRLKRFSGIVPAVSPRIIQDQFGQIAENIDFQSGRLEPITTDSEIYTLASSNINSIEKYRVDQIHVLQWEDENISAVSSPVPGDAYDRFYWTGEDFPRMSTYDSIVSGTGSYPGASYRLGVPPPSAAPTVSKSGTADPNQEPYEVAYVYTLVTSIGEEGPPSEVSLVLEKTDTESITVSLPASNNPSGLYNFSNGLKRIYRSNTGSTNSAFQFVAEVSFATTSYVDNLASEDLGEVLPSATWVGPPDDNNSLYPDGPMQGLIPVGAGILCGFSGNRICFSEPYLPHAWPVQYRITIESDIVGIGAVANGVIVLTEGFPYFVTGTEPSSMIAMQVDLAQACVNRSSIVDMGGYILYAGPDGLAQVNGTEGRVLTKGIITVKQWAESFYPTVIKAFNYEGTYVAFWSSGGEHGAWVYDPNSQDAPFSTVSFNSEVKGGYADPVDGQLYLIVGNKIVKYRGGSSNRTLTWKSKKYNTTSPRSMAVVGVYAQEYPVSVKVWADGDVIADYTLSKSTNYFTQSVTTPANVSSATISEPIMRLPAVLASEWELQVSGSVSIDEIVIAQSYLELKEV